MQDYFIGDSKHWVWNNLIKSHRNCISISASSIGPWNIYQGTFLFIDENTKATVLNDLPKVTQQWNNLDCKELK